MFFPVNKIGEIVIPYKSDHTYSQRVKYGILCKRDETFLRVTSLRSICSDTLYNRRHTTNDVQPANNSFIVIDIRLFNSQMCQKNIHTIHSFQSSLADLIF
jgi:hypothetical protein